MTYGGSGGTYAVTTTHPQASLIAIHEFGHSVGGLADEYATNGHDCNPSSTDMFPNVHDDNSNTGWSHWIGTDKPHVGLFIFNFFLTTSGSEIGSYEGGHYCESGVW